MSHVLTASTSQIAGAGSTITIYFFLSCKCRCHVLCNFRFFHRCTASKTTALYSFYRFHVLSEASQASSLSLDKKKENYTLGKGCIFQLHYDNFYNKVLIKYRNLYHAFFFIALIEVSNYILFISHFVTK